MTYLFTVEVMVKTSVVRRTVGKTVHKVFEIPEFLKGKVFADIFFKFFHCLFKILFGIKESRLVHIVPETVNAHINKSFVFHAEPVTDFFIKKVREKRFAGPYSCDKIVSVFILAEIIFCSTFFVNIIATFFFYGGIYYWNKVDIVIFHLGYKVFEIRKGFFTDCKIFVVVHIVDIKIYGIYRNVIISVASDDFPYFIGSIVTPAALLITKSPFRSYITLTDYFTEFFDNVHNIIAFHNIKFIVGFFHRNC